MKAIDVLKYLLAKAESEVPEGHRIVELNVPVDIVKEIIDAQSEPITAYWKRDAFGTVICSKCGGIRRDNRVGHIQWCNSCGCFMRGIQE